MVPDLKGSQVPGGPRSQVFLLRMEMYSVILTLLRGFLAAWDFVTWPIYQAVYQLEDHLVLDQDDWS